MAEIKNPSIPGQRRRITNKSDNKSNSSDTIIDEKGLQDKAILTNPEQEIQFSVVTTEAGILTNPGKREIKVWAIYTYQVDGDKYLVGKSNDIISKYILQFLVFYDRVSGVRY